VNWFLEDNFRVYSSLFWEKFHLQTQKFEVGHLLLKIHFWVGYPPLGEDFVEKWVVDREKLKPAAFGD
jgi:hypothetical protein